MNKKYFGIIGVILILILVMISSLIQPNKNSREKLYKDSAIIMENANEQSAEYKDSKEQKEFIEIDINTYLEYYNGEENKIVLVARPTCHYCQIAEPIIKKIAYEYKLNINYLNTDNFKDDDAEKFKESDSIFNNGFGTPMLLSISNSKINGSINGLTDYAHYKKFFKDNKFIK